MNDGTNDTMRRFGWPDTQLAEFSHWVVLLRPSQPTLGSLVLAAKGEATSFAALDSAAYAELGRAVAVIEAALAAEIDFQRINYLMLMMVDPHVHFHVIPRYDGTRHFGALSLPDRGWPGPPDLKSAVALDPEIVQRLCKRLRGALGQAAVTIRK